jgi:hypothetical protein
LSLFQVEKKNDLNFFQIFFRAKKVDIENMNESRFLSPSGKQGCQMVCFQTKNPNLSKFWWALEYEMLAYFMTVWNILRPFGITYGRLV